MIKAVIFNMTGVLADPIPYIWESRNMILAEHGIRITTKEIQPTLGQSLREQLKAINKKYDLSLDYEKFSEENKRLSLELMKGRLKATKGAKELIDYLLRNKIKIAIASQNIRENIDSYLEMIGLGNKFDIIVSVEDLTKFKPDPEIFIKTAEKLNVEPKDCLMIDDSIFGMETAKKLGMKTIGFAPKLQKKEELIKHADKVVDFLDEVIEIIK